MWLKIHISPPPSMKMNISLLEHPSYYNFNFFTKMFNRYIHPLVQKDNKKYYSVYLQMIK